MCVFILKEVVQYYVSLGSPIYLCFMAASKAFHKVNHWHLLDKLLNHGISFKVTNGVRQGGILSPRLFTVHVDALSKSLKQSNVGCHFYSICVNHLFYADDCVLIRPSPIALKRLIECVRNIP